MNEDNGFILKAEMYNQEEWYQMYLSMLKVCKKLQQENKKHKEVIDKLRNRLKITTSEEIDDKTYDDMVDILDEAK